MKFAGVITAAGLSSRMDGFKPLMEINGFPMIGMTVQSMKNAGIQDITVVTGYRAKEMEKVIAPMKVRIVENHDYRNTDMLASIKIGLAETDTADGVFILPGDIPLTAPDSFGKMMEKISLVSPEICALLPTTAGRQVHPPFLFPEGKKQVLEYQGSGGMKGIWESMQTAEVAIEDEGAQKDADVRKDFDWMQNYAKVHKGISKKLCEEFYREVSLPQHIQAHCRAVGNLAGWMAETLTAHGAFLDVELCRSGGWLHDLFRLKPNHEEKAGVFLRDRGYLALAKVVEDHRGFEKEPVTVCQESVIVCLADKLIQETERVSIERRYQKALGQDVVKERILRDIRICRRLAEEFEVITGERLYSENISE